MATCSPDPDPDKPRHFLVPGECDPDSREAWKQHRHMLCNLDDPFVFSHASAFVEHCFDLLSCCSPYE